MRLKSFVEMPTLQLNSIHRSCIASTIFCCLVNFYFFLFLFSLTIVNFGMWKTRGSVNRSLCAFEFEFDFAPYVKECAMTHCSLSLTRWKYVCVFLLHSVAFKRFNLWCFRHHVRARHAYVCVSVYFGSCEIYTKFTRWQWTVYSIYVCASYKNVVKKMCAILLLFCCFVFANRSI